MFQITSPGVELTVESDVYIRKSIAQAAGTLSQQRDQDDQKIKAQRSEES